MQPEGSLAHSQAPTTCPYPEAVQKNSLSSRACEMFVTPCSWGGVVNTSPNTQDGGPLLVGTPPLLIRYLVASECSQNHFISEEYKTLQLIKLYFLQNSPLVQVYNSASDCKCVGSIPENHFVRTFSALPLHS